MAAPLLAVVLLGITSGWTSMTQIAEMHHGLRAGANFVLQGGTDLNAAKEAALSSWANRPSTGAVNVTQQCTCAGAASGCTGLCPDGTTVPQISIVIAGTTSLDAPIFDMVSSTKVSISRQEIVRVR